MPQTADETRTAQLDKREAFLNALQEQLRKDGEHLHEDAKRRVAAEQAKLDQRAAALAPKETDLKAREGVVSAQERALAAREQVCSTTEAQQRHVASAQAKLEGELRVREQATKDREAQHLRLQAADFAQVDTKRQQLREEFELREARLTETRDALQAQRTEQEKREAQIAKDRERADLKLEAAHTTEETSTREARDLRASQDARERTLDAQADGLSKREAAMREAQRVQRERAEELASEALRLEHLAKGLNKAKLDIEIKEAQVEKRERLVNAIAKRKEVAEELAKLE